jgi:hypothetical protein
MPFIEFGTLVLVITLATAAIVSSGRPSSGANSGESAAPLLDVGESEQKALPLSLDDVDAEPTWLEFEMDDAKKQ